MKLIKLTITLDSSLVDSLSDFLIGVHDAAIELSVTDGDGPVTLQAFAEKDVSSIDEVESVIAQVREYGFELAQIFACDPPKITVEFLEDRDWSESWKVHFKPFAIVPGLVIAPSWEKYEPAPDEKVIVMDPGMAFGTGHHETTRLCLEVLSQTEAVVKGGTMLDVGTGTGILAMASVLFGARHAVGIDNDTEAVKAARDNCRLNSLSEKIEISDRPLEDIESTFDLVVANIVHDVLLELSKDLGRVASGGSLLLSGLMDGNQSENIIHCFVDKGFQLIEKRTDDQWCALLFDKAV
ncbi:MAG: 50S ribosomal protein L11 methyltransferase [Desulfofustis sp.]|nr:50S ribosomal protein L11 methyltransferase [Desulfofustis sp.]